MATSRREILGAAALAAGLAGGAQARQAAPAPRSPRDLSQAAAPRDVGPTVSQVWGEAVSALRFEDLPSEVVERAKWCLLDNLALLAFGADDPANLIFLGRSLEAGGKAEARLPFRREALPAEATSEALAYLIHANDFDDNDFRGSYRPSCVAVPPVLAVADWKRASGRDLIVGLAIAYTLTGRLAAMAPNMQQWGFMPSAIFGSAGGAAAAARLMDLDAERTAWAIGLGAAAGGGLFQYYLDQTEDKKLHVARTSRTSVEMAIMAERGFVGPHRAIEGLAGMNGYLQGREIRMTKGPLVAEMDAWEGPLHITPKFFAASASIGPFLDALDPIWSASGLTGEDVDHFTIVREWSRDGVAGRKVLDFHPPATLTGGQLDMAYSIALYLMTGDAGPRSFTEARLHDPAILALADKADYRQTGPEGPFMIEVALKSGRTLSAPFIYPSGEGPSQPLMEAARLKKIERLTAGRLDEATRLRFIDEVMGVERQPDVRPWLDGLRAVFGG